MNRLAFYKTNEDLEDEDIGYEAPLYSIDFYDKEYIISLGHERKLEAKKNTYYFPVYLIDNSTVFKQIGVYEFESDEKSQKERWRTFLDKDGDIDPKRLNDILLYPFADRDFFDNSTFSVSKSDISMMEEKMSSSASASASASAAPHEEFDPNDPLQLSIPVGKMSESVAKSNSLLKDGVFEHDTTVKIPVTLVEESKDESLRIKKEYKMTKANQWIENFMKNNNYDIVNTADNGDCYFDTIRIAFLQIGYVTTIEKLRAIVANSADEELFDFYESQYIEVKKEKDDLDNEKDVLLKDKRNLIKRLKTIGETNDPRTKIEIDAIKKQLIEIEERDKVLTEYIVRARDIFSDFNFMQSIKSLEQLREYMKTSSYWADERAIYILEKELNFKTIVFSHYHYKEGDLNWILEDKTKRRKKINYNKDVLVCTTGEPIEPKFYIMTEYSGSHYRLISYKNKYILTFSEIPYDVKIMITIKCMENPSSIYNRIMAFRNFQTKLGISAGNPQEDDDDEEMVGGGDQHAHYDPKIQFVFYNKSADGLAPGKGAYEKMPTGKNNEFADLFLKKNREWRKMLDDYWPAEFKLDGLEWYSVEHYYQASKFRKAHPEFYKSFSLTGNPDIARDVDMARVAGSKSGAFKDTQLRPTNIKVDSDFYGARYREEREKAVFAKFSQNEDLKKILLLTKDAKLVKYVPKKETETDTILMKVRKELRK